MGYKVRRVVYEDVAVDPNELVTLAYAARILGMSKPGVINALERGMLTEIIDDERTYHGRRLILKSELVTYQARKKKN